MKRKRQKAKIAATKYPLPVSMKLSKYECCACVNLSFSPALNFDRFTQDKK